VFKEARAHGLPINVIVLTTMIHAFGMHGRSEHALELFYEFEKTGTLPPAPPLPNSFFIVSPNAQTLAAVLCACSHTKLVDEAIRIYDSMQPKYGVTPAVEHHNALVDVLSRAGTYQSSVR
jgi:pentatricopeptide repeat protein